MARKEVNLIEFYSIQKGKLKALELEKLRYSRESDATKDAKAEKYAKKVLDAVIAPELRAWRDSLSREERGRLEHSPQSIANKFAESVNKFITLEEAKRKKAREDEFALSLPYRQIKV